MSLCDTCHSPGHCCRDMNLYGNGLEDPDMLEHEAVEILNAMDLPFVPYGRDNQGALRFMCPHLTNEGRCGVYENRPDTCRNFEPASGPLCVYYEAPPDEVS